MPTIVYAAPVLCTPNTSPTLSTPLTRHRSLPSDILLTCLNTWSASCFLSIKKMYSVHVYITKFKTSEHHQKTMYALLSQTLSLPNSLPSSTSARLWVELEWATRLSVQVVLPLNRLVLLAKQPHCSSSLIRIYMLVSPICFVELFLRILSKILCISESEF